MRTHFVLLWLSVGVLPALAGAVPRAVEVPAGATDILTPESYWRWFLVLRKPIIPVEALKAAGKEAAAPKPLVGTVVQPPYNTVDQQDSPASPAGWELPAFDDFGWPRSRLTWLAPNAFGRFSSAALCLRGKFQVTDPAAVQGLFLTIKYYGGLRVCLNGREFARQHLPAGKLAGDTPAEMYPKEVYVDDKGAIVPMGDYEYGWNHVPADVKKDAEARRANRTRVLGPLKLPADAMRKGENVLTVEVRRAEYPLEALRWFKAPEGRTKPFWVPMNIFELRLQATGGGVAPNLARPNGPQVWTENINDRISVLDYGDQEEGLRPIRIVGARNGSFCGQLVIGSDKPLKDVRVTVGEFKAVKFARAIPASRVTVLYALPDVSYYGCPTWFDALQSEPPAEVALDPKGGGALLPVLLRVLVPKDAAPGDYRSVAIVSGARSQPVRVPLELSVAGWVVPEPSDYRTYVGVYQSPTTLAMKYRVKEWSEEHWRLMEKSFALLGRAGNKLLNVTVVDQTQFGNDDGMIYWVRKSDGSYTYDFTVFDRLTALARKHFKKLDFVALHVWNSGGWETRAADQRNTVTVIDEKTGRREHLQVPKFGTEASKRFWKPFLDAVHARLARQGLDSAMCLGILSDGTAPPEVFKAFDEITPGGAKWMRGCHSGTFSETPDPLRGGGKTVLHEFCYGLNMPDPAKPLPPVWNQRNKPGTAYDRISNHEVVVPLSWYRDTAMCSLLLRTRGVGRICLDFWNVLGSREPTDIYNCWPYSSCAQRAPSLKSMTWAGPKGAETTLRYEAFCEGIQYAEAMIAVSEALEKKPHVLGPERTDALRQVLVDLVLQQDKYRGPYVPLRPNHEGWQPLAKRLLEAAAQAGTPRSLGPARE
ncbi:MAG: glycoside hydrolase domain-containing protein [Thermoguttaceae bacterium]|jgi:hypothetical protein